VERHTCIHANGDCKTWIAPLLVVAIALGGCAGAKKPPSASYSLSGYEISPGQRDGSRTNGALFSGWTHAEKAKWEGDSNPGSLWSVSANYSGRPGIGGSASLTGGRWLLTDGDAVIVGTITGGTITWPSSLTTELSGRGCGQGIGHMNVNVSTKDGRAGKMIGCLDDTHIHHGTFPPKVWGTLTFP
jgi:hypothetical protein